MLLLPIHVTFWLGLVTIRAKKNLLGVVVSQVIAMVWL